MDEFGTEKSKAQMGNNRVVREDPGQPADTEIYRTISSQFGQLITVFVSHITRKIEIFTKGFIKFSSQFISSGEQSTFVISYISLLRHLTDNPHHLFIKSCSTVIKSRLVCWQK
ncbi:hypothetical protein AMTR_s00225p00016560 [Amborella trichopoda]|uniref:Uncharacterized protein n=1 Tax=Amborella trichopoda TaxID=13333 RepID=W1NYB6_AMBTC|nr:hypothetical protein AMTR_s00225p00016560 [Amborella trichopoda]